MNKFLLYAIFFSAVNGLAIPAVGQERIAPSIACEGPNSNNVKGLTFQFRSAVLTIVNGGRPISNLRVTLAMKNSTDMPIGVFVFQPETSASTDTGLTLNTAQAFGMSLCVNTRDQCNTTGTITTIGANATTNAILVLQGAGPSDEDSKRELSEAKSVDFAGVVHAVVGSEKGYLPISCVEMPLRNMIAH